MKTRTEYQNFLVELNEKRPTVLKFRLIKLFSYLDERDEFQSMSARQIVDFISSKLKVQDEHRTEEDRA